MPRQKSVAIKRPFYLLVAGAVNHIAGSKPAQGDSDTAEQGERDRMLLENASRRRRKSARRRDNDPAEYATSEPAGHTAQWHRKPIGTVVQHGRPASKVGVVADQCEGGQAGCDNGA